MPSENLITKMADALGLPASTPAEQVIDAAMRRIAEIEAAQDRRIAAAAVRGGDCPPPSRGSGMEWTLDWAQATRRISAASRPQWETNWQRDPEGTQATVRILARSNAETAPIRASTSWVPQTASGLDVSQLPPRLRRVAAGCADRETVFRLIETYGGETAEPDPAILRLEGLDDVAEGIQAAIGEERTAELDAWTRTLNETTPPSNAASPTRFSASDGDRQSEPPEGGATSRERPTVPGASTQAAGAGSLSTAGKAGEDDSSTVR